MRHILPILLIALALPCDGDQEAAVAVRVKGDVKNKEVFYYYQSKEKDFGLQDALERAEPIVPSKNLTHVYVIREGTAYRLNPSEKALNLKERIFGNDIIWVTPGALVTRTVKNTKYHDLSLVRESRIIRINDTPVLAENPFKELTHLIEKIQPEEGFRIVTLTDGKESSFTVKCGQMRTIFKNWIDDEAFYEELLR